MDIVIFLFLVLQTLSFIVGSVWFLLINSMDEDSIIKGFMKTVKEIKDNPITHLILIGYPLGVLISFLVVEIIFFPYTIDKWLKNREKKKKLKKEPSKLEIDNYRWRERTFKYKGKEFTCNVINDKRHHLILSMEEMLNYIYNTDILTYSQMDYTLEVIFNNLKYIFENDVWSFDKHLEKSIEVIKNIYTKVKEDKNKSDKEYEQKRREIVAKYKSEMDNVYNSLNEFWSEVGVTEGDRNETK